MKKGLLKIASFFGLFRKTPRLHIEKFLEKHKTDELTLDLGGGSGPYDKFFPKRVGFDIEPGPGVDFVGDAHNLSFFKDNEFGCILCTEVLEHLYDPKKAVDEMFRVLKPGGKLILTTRFIFPLHNIPGDYFRFTRYGLAHLMKNFSKVIIEEETGTIGTLAVLFERMGFQTDTLGTKILSGCWFVLARLVSFLKFVTTREYGDITRKEKIRNIMTSGYLVSAIK